MKPVLPIIDPLTCSSEELLNVCKKYGMFYSPIGNIDISSVLNTMNDYFSLDKEIKMKDFIPNTMTFNVDSHEKPKLGYNISKKKEIYSYHVQKDTQNKSFLIYNLFCQELSNLSQIILNKLFVDQFNETSNSLSLVNYFSEECDDTQLLKQHYDWGLLTFLITTEPGLQMHNEELEKWIDVPPIDKYFIVNLGNIMKYLFDFNSPLHRVVNTSIRNKKSIVFFAEPISTFALYKEDAIKTYIDYIRKNTDYYYFIKSINS
jgi:isopenicillin N synthase-like dioxygenase